MKRRAMVCLLILGTTLATAAALPTAAPTGGAAPAEGAPPEGAQWQEFSALGPGDAALAQAIAAPFWGDDPSLWPDWVDLRAVRLPTRSGGTLLVVRVPWHAPCGQYGITILGPVTPEGTRARLGADFCAGSIEVIPVAGLDLPDLVLREGRVEDAATGTWTRLDQRIRWVRDRWLTVQG